MPSVRSLLVAIAACLLAVGPAAAQTTFASITGMVTDPTGTSIPNASAEATHVQSGYRYTAQSNEAGIYTLAQLRDGTYTLRVHAAGFKEFVAQDIVLVSREGRRLDVRLELGTVESRIEVTAGAALIETETARISDIRSDAVLKAMPRNSRNVSAFLGLTPGVLAYTSGERRFAGSHPNQSEATIDGITSSNMNSTSSSTVIGPLTTFIESYQEIRVDMANNTAEFGTIGQVTVVTKAGANTFHGTLFDYYSTPWFRARNPFSPERGTGITHNPGFTAGAPVHLPGVFSGRNRTFWYYSFETTRGSQRTQLMQPTVPLAPWRAGDFSALAPTVVRDPFAGNTPFPGNRLPAARISSVSQKLQDRFYPLPNYGDPNVFANQNFRQLMTRAFDGQTTWSMRFDHRISEKSFLYGRYQWNRSYSMGFDGALPTIGQKWQQRDTRAASVSYSHSFSPTLLNEVRWGVAFNQNPRHGPLNGKQLVQELGLRGLVDNLPDMPGIFKISFSGIGLAGISQTDWNHPGSQNFPMQFQEQLSWFRGRHSLKAGMLWSRVGFADAPASSNLFGSATFSNRFTGHPYADFLLGIPTTAARGFPPVRIDNLRWAKDFFVTDDFKITRQLTLSIGARYEYRPYWREQSGLQSVFDVGSGKIVVPDGALSKVSPLLPRGYVDVVEARQAGYTSAALIKTDVNNVAPRIGIAYRPWGNHTVFRAGYGIFYDTNPASTGSGGAPFVISEPSYTNPAAAPTVVFPLVFPLTGTGGPTTVSIPRGIRTDLRYPFSMQYNLTLEHERWKNGFRLSYIGTNTRQGLWTYNINQPVADTRAYVDKPRLFPRYPAVNYQTNGAGHQYHSLTAEVKRRMARGLYYQGSWVWARDIEDGSPENAYDRRRERGVVEVTPTHRIIANFIYELPFGKGKPFAAGVNRWLNLLIGGWELDGIYAYHSGQFLTPSWSGPDPTGTAYTTSRTPAQVSIRPNILRDPNLPRDQRTIRRWFDASAFTAPSPGAFGTSANGVIIGPGSNNWNAGFVKNFLFTERARLRWEMTATNVFNHPNWSNPATNISSATQVGVITGVGGVADYDGASAREFRMGVRLEW